MFSYYYICEKLIMKKIFTLLSLIFSLVIFAQDFQFEEVVKVDSTITKEELFNRARTWIGKTYNNEKFVIATEDKNNGELSGNGMMNYHPGRNYFGSGVVKGEVNYKINIYVKDGRYKYLFHSFRHTGSSIGMNQPINYGMITGSADAPKPSRGGSSNTAWKDIKEESEFKIKKIIESLKASMNKEYEASKEW